MRILLSRRLRQLPKEHTPVMSEMARYLSSILLNASASAALNADRKLSAEVIFMDNENIYIRENVLERCVVDCEKTVIIHALTRTNGNHTAAAKLLGTTRRILDSTIHKYALECAH